MLTKYGQYLQVIDEKITNFFESQKDYIFCKEGCSACCEIGEYPYTLREIQYLLLGFHQLSTELKIEILEKINEIKKARDLHKESGSNEPFVYACPFLINKKCSVYEFRGLICRTYGLAFYDKNKRLWIPQCADEGLNYAAVYDKEKDILSTKMWEKTGLKTKPVAFNLGREFLLNNEATQHLELDFGEEKPMVEWL